jgi:membrane-associated phospholipid phosphatase
MMAIIQIVTHFGDLAIMIPLIVILAAWLLWVRGWITVAWWLIAVVLCAGSIALLKIYFFACPLSELRSPSGHSSLSTLVYGALALIVAAQWQGWRRITIIGLGVLLVAGVAFSRILLGAHNWPEVITGVVVGLFALTGFSIFYLRYRTAQGVLWPLLVAAIVVVILFNDQEVQAETFLHQLSVFLHIHQSMCA